MKYIKLYEDTGEPTKHVVKRHPNGRLYIEEWRQNGQLHHEDGPAWIDYYQKGQVSREEFWVNGSQYDSEEELWYGKMGLL